MEEKVIISKKYYIKPDGKIYRISDDTEKVLKPSGAGYIHISLNGIQKYIHRLIAEAFIPNPENKRYVDHINGITTDNRVENLRWVTNSENALNIHKRDIKRTDVERQRSRNWKQRHKEQNKEINRKWYVNNIKNN